MRYFLLIMSIVFAISALAGVYTYTDSSGNIVFTDTPQPNSNAQRLTADDIGKPIVVPRQTTQTQQNTTGGMIESQNVQYQSFALISPQDQETFQNQPSITVDVSSNPPLQKGDMVQIFLDGAAWGPAQATTHFTFIRPDRGTRTISAKLLNKNQQILLETKPITVFIHQAHLGTFQ